MYRIHQIKVPFEHSQEDLKRQACKQLGIKLNDIVDFSIFKRSIDARKEVLQYVYAVDVETKIKLNKKFKPNEISIVNKTEYIIPRVEDSSKFPRPIIVGLGPAGLFCSYVLAKAGFKPICVERGKAAAERTKDVNSFFETGKLNTQSNVCFGEGGAGTFSDGKLNTLIKDKDGKGRYVLETFVKYGADADIMYDNKPHVGTDKLINIVTSMRQEIERLGGDVLFNTQVTNILIENGAINGVQINNKEIILSNRVIFATGHSARDTFEMLNSHNLNMEAKPYAIGVRVLHKQQLINESQYGQYANRLPAASYKLTHTCENGRGVYSFCMCPGGYVVNATNEEGATVVNGMSYSDRSGEYANSAIICSVTPADYENEGFGNDCLSGVRFQKYYEEITFKEGNGCIPVQYLGDFNNNTKSDIIDNNLPIKGKYSSGNIKNCLPKYVSESITEGMNSFEHRIHGFGDEKVLLCGIETRTSSPLRITRNDNLQSNVCGIYPCGEGAGYAGGIMSASLDGIKVAEQILSELL